MLTRHFDRAFSDTSDQRIALPQSMAPQDPLTDTLLNDRFRVRARIRETGMATVYSGLDTKDGTVVSIKFLNTDMQLDRESNRRFEREGQLLQSLRHENILSFKGCG